MEDEIPDAIILDTDTPRMDGLTFLRKLMAQYPLPVVIISSAIDVESADATETLEAGAMDVVVLPKIGARAHLLASAGAVRGKIKSAVQRRLRSPAQGPSQTVSPKLTADVILPPPNRRAKVSPTERLLDDIRARKLDVIVVYKVDRLTRSLADFAKLVELFDAHGVSFVSVTQQFNTTTSMGRLTLNVLLSFAQFEREVTSERIRDKIAASKRKGLWVGGPLPLGYRMKDDKVAVVEDEANGSG
jgi:hypothetical protein